ncbi:MAG: hypothetical protein HYT20_02785 [Candidatus Nealsonbacteria bacterium]|nr:hypothetical protein [Candidatus Nealsonbacteria bacterium]
MRGVVRLTNPYAQMIMDRGQLIDGDFVGAIVGQSVMSWEGRNPTPALDQNGNFRCTDLDLLSFLMPIAARRAVIEIPHYRNRRKIVVKANERKIDHNQFGPVTGVISNKEVFSFSVRIHDKTIVKKDLRTEEEEIGAYRNYMVVDCDGHWYHGWDRIVFDPSAEENIFLSEKGLWTGNTVYFKNYVHPNRWQSIFSSQHLLKKMLILRIDDEAGFYRSEMKRLEAMGISLPIVEGPVYSPTESEGETVPISVSTLEMVLDIPQFSGSYNPAPNTREGLSYAYRRQKHLTYTLKPWVQFGVRANEAAYFLFGNRQVASWMEGRTWKQGWKAPGGRIEWNQMVLSPSVALRYRVRSVTQRVSAE